MKIGGIRYGTGAAAVFPGVTAVSHVTCVGISGDDAPFSVEDRGYAEDPVPQDWPNRTWAACWVSVYSRTAAILPSRTVKMPTLRLWYAAPPRAVAREVHSATTWSPAVRTLVTSSATVDPGSSAVPTLPRKSSTMVSRPRQVPDSGRSPGYSQMASSAKLSRIAPLSPSRTA